MSRSLATSLALTAAALFLGACGKEQPTTTNPGAGGASAGDTAGDAAGDGASDVAAVEVKCLGINECSGQSLCDVAGSHDCGGQNSCKGKGWILVSEPDCQRKGGQIIPAENEGDGAEEGAADEAAEAPV
ncbi:MAG: hypothetical protein H6712_09175 [Myxococcales bacterium]|nr:hypothetical protein [Myxococcales bacterium]MCB9714013.1 hypothetical protein [Myxococcales bacterium]